MADLELLTSRQREIYSFIRSKIQGRGYGPTVREIGNEFGIKSPNGVMCHLKALQKKGLIHREANMSRAITLLQDTPAGVHTCLKMLGRDPPEHRGELEAVCGAKQDDHVRMVRDRVHDEIAIGREGIEAALRQQRRHVHPREMS